MRRWESYGVYVDLVRAFGTVNRMALWEVLRKFGMSGHFVNMPVRLHAGVMVNVKIGPDGTAMGSPIGMRQNAFEGPTLIPFIMQAALEIDGVVRD